MKIIDWFKSLLSIMKKKEYMLNEKNTEDEIQDRETVFIPKVDIDNLEHQKKREDILMNLRNDIIVENYSEYYNYSKFNFQNIKEKYDNEDVLSDNDITVLECLYKAIKDGNLEEDKIEDNKINIFLKQKPNNIVKLVDILIKKAEDIHEKLDEDTFRRVSVRGLISDSYRDISEFIKEYYNKV